MARWKQAIKQNDNIGMYPHRFSGGQGTITASLFEGFEKSSSQSRLKPPNSTFSKEREKKNFGQSSHPWT